MTPADEARVIARRDTGTEIAAMAQAFGIPLRTVRSWAHALLQQGKIQARPKGGSYPRRRTQARQAGEPPSVHSSAEQGSAEQSGAVQPPAALVPSPAVTSAAIIDLLRQTLARLDTVEHDLKAIREDRQPSAGQSRAVQSGAEPPTLTPDEARAEQWNLWLPRGLRQRIEAVARARGHAPSKVVQEVLWRWVTEEER